MPSYGHAELVPNDAIAFGRWIADIFGDQGDVMGDKRVIWKFPWPIMGSASATMWMPARARVLDFQIQRHAPTLWALCDPEAPKVARSFRIYGTGQPLEDHGTYIGTAQDGDFVWHAFEVA